MSAEDQRPPVPPVPDRDGAIRADLADSRNIDVSGVRTICLALGPYRNLTSWTAATLFLHPRCQVLNHAGNRVFGQPEVDFLDDFSPAKLSRFLQYAVLISAGGRRGPYGGSILHSHALDTATMREAASAASPEPLKARIDAFFWKESLLTANTARARGVDLVELTERDPRLRFLQPVRHPLDTAHSNLATDHHRRFADIRRDADVVEVLAAVLDELAWYAALRVRRPDRFHHFFEYELSRASLAEMATFLGLDPDEEWLGHALAGMRIKPGYDHPPALVSAYREMVGSRFAEHPDLMTGLLAFVD